MIGFSIEVRDHENRLYANDWAETEEDARQQASGWTGQRGQMRWTAIIRDDTKRVVATYKRGKAAGT